MEEQSALVILSPPEVQLFAARLQSTVGENLIPAHITLLFPFAPPAMLDGALQRLADVCREFSPFQITLERYGRFLTTVFLEPSDPEPILRLFRRLTSAFPEYPPYAGEFGAELRPHLTLAHSDDPAILQRLVLPPVPSFNFNVERLDIFVGVPEAWASWTPRATVPFGAQV
jgi:2'-5' RNA ligase